MCFIFNKQKNIKEAHGKRCSHWNIFWHFCRRSDKSYGKCYECKKYFNIDCDKCTEEEGGQYCVEAEQIAKGTGLESV